ncbi:aminoglycoside phosphotransferase family protein [Rhizobium leguminosarum bv. viciae]|uniref:phosphotransferase n=1 Tax=Rhizobium leguminosarum TaxID=384 RepID=UPI00103AB75B|nr:phosphotransferase [Rhizobium leguminosarum]TBY68957.1 aminoglycoside phosphotransferase family protein [Rhizobium leguminosarum bv. viciae]
MDRSASEIPLNGGRVTQGVVRVGDTVRRPPTYNSPFIHQLLEHLENAGFEGAPRSMGYDNVRRDTFSYIEGDVPKDLSWHGDEVLTEAAQLMRRYHDATVGLVASPAAQSVGLEVVCHNDLSPCNFVFRSGRPMAIIDFDSASPGTRLHDLGYAAWTWLDLGDHDVDADAQRYRLAMFCRAYDANVDLAQVVDFILLRQRILAAQGRRIGDVAMERWATECLKWTIEHFDQHFVGGANDVE